MKTLRLMVLFCSVLGLLGVFSYMSPGLAHPDDPHPNPLNTPLISTASDVTADRSNLPTFVGHALAHLQSVTTFAEATELVDEFRNMGDWNDGSTYLVLLTGSGGVQAHMDNRELEDEDLVHACRQSRKYSRTGFSKRASPDWRVCQLLQRRSQEKLRDPVYRPLYYAALYPDRRFRPAA